MDVVVIGAGPAGLTCAYELSKSGISSTILDAADCVGGLSRTVAYKSYLFDIGGHRFYTRVKMVSDMWREVLGADLIRRPRLSRIYYQSRFFEYPLQPFNALLGLGLGETVFCSASYIRAQLFPRSPEENLESWVSNRFGRRLYETFFKSYTEKVWGIPCRQIRSDWAAQRIQGVSVGAVLRDALGWRRMGTKHEVRSLIREFEYPIGGPGMMWSRTRDIVEARGSKTILNAPVTRISWEPGAIRSVVAGDQVHAGTHFVSSMPIRNLIQALDPFPPELGQAAADFNYRDFITVGLICRGGNIFPDNWIYVHEPSVQVGRIQNYGNWSPAMAPVPDTSALGLEYFCFKGDKLWESSDRSLIELAKHELAQLGLVKPENVLDGIVIRVPKAYPVYDDSYKHGIDKVRKFLASVPNLQLVGRNGMHRYNNQDHSMLTAMLAARNILGADYDIWQANTESQYGESGADIREEDLRRIDRTQPMVPRRI